MKFFSVLILALAVMSNSAHASRARLEALGEGKNGSYYVNDARNLFLNPASIIRHKKKLMLELGNAEPGNFNSRDSTSDSRAQGGWIDSMGDLTYAVYLNNASDDHREVFDTKITNAVEIALAGEGAIVWGFSLAHNYGPTGANTVNTWDARFGLSRENLSVFGTVGLYGRAVALGVETQSKLNLDLGTTYRLGDFTLFGNYTTLNLGPGGNYQNMKSHSYAVGAGYQKELTRSLQLFTRVQAGRREVKDLVGPVGLNGRAWNLPVVIGAEAQALSWLTLRGSVSHSLLGQTDSANTNVAAGIGLHLGDVLIDGLVATDGGAEAQNLGTHGMSSSSTFGFGDRMISRIALTYQF